MQRIFKFERATGYHEDDELALVSPMSLGKYSAVHGVQPQDFEGGLPSDIRRLQTFLDGGKKKLLNELRKENATVQ